jgi:hypothetical protein
MTGEVKAESPPPFQVPARMFGLSHWLMRDPPGSAAPHYRYWRFLLCAF